MLKSVLAVMALLVSLSLSLPADTIATSLTDSQLQSGFTGYVPGPLYTPDNVPVPVTAVPFDFSGSPLDSLLSIDSLSITFTVWNGSTGPGMVDYNNWYLFLDGINTGLVLNGFPENFQTATLTFSGTPDNQALLLAALQDDGMLVPTILDVFDNSGSSRIYNVIQLPNAWKHDDPINATLQLNVTLDGSKDPSDVQTPEPATLGLMGLGLIGLLTVARRRRLG